MSIALRALVRAAWQEDWNRRWRFSAARSGLWLTLAEMGLAALVVYRLGQHAPVGGAGPVILFGALQAALFAFMSLFLWGRGKLYSGPVVQLIHLSPTPAQAVILAELISGLPRRAWGALLFTAALWPALPAGARSWAAPALWLAALAAGLLGQMAGLLALVAWVRSAPRWLGAVWALFLVLNLALLYGLAYLLITGISPAALATALQGAGRLLPLALILLFVLPGLLMLLRLLRTPRAAGEAYREGWLNLMELGDADTRPRRSAWPRIAPGPAGAIQALVWQTAWRNWFSRLRLGLWAAGTAAIILAGPALGRLPEDRLALFVLGLGLGMGLLNYGEQAAALFSADGPRLALAAMAGVRPHQLLLGKWLAALPLALVAAITTGVAGLAAGQPAGQAAALASIALAIALGAITFLVGAAAFDASPLAPGESPAEESVELAAAFEQVPTRPGGMAGLLGAILFAGSSIWLLTAEPGLLPLLALLPAAGAVAGYARLRRLLKADLGSRM